jgi:hypothetical protein
MTLLIAASVYFYTITLKLDFCFFFECFIFEVAVTLAFGLELNVSAIRFVLMLNCSFHYYRQSRERVKYAAGKKESIHG